MSSEDRGRMWALIGELACTAVVWVLMDETRLQAAQMRGWHLVRRGAWWGSARLATIGYKAQRRYDAARG